jgi:hypothetical protein
VKKEQINEHLAYIAGLIDGEGYVGITRAKTSKSAKGCKRGISYRLLVSVTMTDIRPLKFALRHIGLGRIITRKIPKNGFRVPWTWSIWSKQASTVLNLLLPWLIVKKEQAKLCIKFQSIMRSPGNLGLHDSEWKARETLFAKVKGMNYGRKQEIPKT